MFSRYDRNAIKRHRILFLMLFSASGMASGEAAFATYSQSEYSHVITTPEAKIDQYRMQEIEQLQVVLSRSAPKEQSADMVLRLAELYTEKYKLLFSKENDIWAQKMDAYLRQSLAVQKESRRPTLDNGGSRQWLAKAVSTLERIPELHGNYNKLDEVYYFLGFNNWELGRKDKAIQSFENIVRNYPKSKFSAEANRYIADHAFASRNFVSAKKHYEEAANSNMSPSRPRVLYGLAWSHYKLREYSSAVTAMSKAISLSRQDESAEKAGVGLQRDAIDSLAMFYSEGGDANAAAGFFADLLGKTEAQDALRKLAANYQHEGRYSQALAINKQLIDAGGSTTAAGEEQRFQIMLDSLHVAQNKNDHDRVSALLKQLTAEYVTNAKAPNEDKIEQTRILVRKNALLAHQEGNKSKNSKAAFARAEELYHLYLSAFASRLKSEDADEIHYLLADALSQQGKHQAAANEFKNILDSSAANPNDPILKKYQRDSAVGLIYSLDSFFKTKQGKQLSTPDANQLVAAIDTYVRMYPNDKDAPKYLARAAGILVTNNRMDEARPRLLQLAETYPSCKEAVDAAVTLIKDSDARKDYQAASELSERILRNTALMAQDKKGTMRAQLQSISSRAKFNQVQTLEKDQNFGVAAQKYEQLAQDSKDNEVRYKALNNAAVSYSRAGDQANELRIYEKILEIYPTDEQSGKNILSIANDHFTRGQYDASASLFERYYAIFSKHITTVKAATQKSAADAIRAAALLRSALSEQDKAGNDYREIVIAANQGVSSARQAAEEFLFDGASKLNASGNSTEAVRAYQKYMSAFPNGKYAIDCTLNMGILYAQLQEDEKAQNYITSVMQKVKAKGKSASPGELAHGAHARLLLLAPLENTFNNAPLRLPEAQLKVDINAKLAALDRLNKGYIEVIEFGDGNWGVEAFSRMAMAYRSFAQKLENAPVPSELSPEDKAKFRAQLRNVAGPVYTKVSETLENALKKGESLSVPGNVMAKVYILAALNAARPDRYPLVQELVWANPSDWAMGEIPADEAAVQKFRDNLLKKNDELNSWLAIGNWHLFHGQEELAKMFFLKALAKNSKFVPAINNLAYLEGKNGKLPDATAGFKTALNNDEFAVQPKKNLCRIYMASGLWRHANLAYRQLEVRTPSDPEVKKGLGLSYLAIGKISSAEPLVPLFTAGDDVNSRFASAIWALAKGDQAKAKEEIQKLAGKSQFADLLNQNWAVKEGS